MMNYENQSNIYSYTHVAHVMMTAPQLLPEREVLYGRMNNFKLQPRLKSGREGGIRISIRIIKT